MDCDYDDDINKKLETDWLIDDWFQCWMLIKKLFCFFRGYYYINSLIISLILLFVYNIFNFFLEKEEERKEEEEKKLI